MLFALQGHCQTTDGEEDTARPDEDTSAVFAADTSIQETKADTLIWPQEKGDLSTNIIYTAQDSMVMDVPHRKVYLYGKAKVEYGDISLTSERITVDWAKSEMRAYGLTDSTGRYKGRPYFKQGADEYVCDSMAYGISSGKGLIYNIVTEQNGGYVSGSPVKRTNEAVYIKKGTYTTCNMGHPHFYIQAHKLKIIPEREIISGPFHMVISDIPTPIGFPLGFFPIVDKGKSGVIFPTIGENRSRGFFISRGGYYLKVKEVMGISVIGDFYSNGSTLLTLNNVYKRRYNYDGTFAVNFSRVRDGFGKESDNPYSYQYNVRWVHKTGGTKGYSFSSDVNISSNSFYSKNSYDQTRVQSNVFNSGVIYYKAIRNSPFNFTISGNHNQNVQTKVMNVTLPNVSVNMNRVYPFRKKVGSGNIWYEKIAVSVAGNGSYSFTNKIHDYDTGTDSTYEFNQTNYQKILENGTIGGRWDVPISATFNVLRYFNLTPSINYSEYWYNKRLEYTYDTTTKTVTSIYQHGFYRTNQYNASVSMNTWIYGKWSNRGKGALRGVLHSINPTVAYRFQPDFSKIGDNYQTFDQSVDIYGNKIAYNRYANGTYGSPSSGMQNVLSWTITNILEAKYKSRKDTVNLNGKKIKLIDNIGITSSYDFTKKVFKMSNWNLNARTRVAGFDLNFSSVFDPYIYVADTSSKKLEQGIRVNQYAVAEGQGLAKLTSMVIGISRTFGPKKLKNSPTTAQKLSNVRTQEAQNIVAHPNEYVDFNMPWGLTVNYSYGFNKTGLANPVLNQGLTFNGNVNITPKWKLTATTGYDFVHQGISNTSITIYRDLHCWQASFTCIPVGSNQSYFFTFNAKSTLLQDLKLNKRSPAFFGQYY